MNSEQMIIDRLLEFSNNLHQNKEDLVRNIQGLFDDTHNEFGFQPINLDSIETKCINYIEQTFKSLLDGIKTPDKMREDLVDYKLGNMKEEDIRGILGNGFVGYEEMDDEEIIDEWELIFKREEPEDEV